MNMKLAEDTIIQKIYIKYQTEHKISLPTLQQIKRLDLVNCYAMVLSEDLFCKNYILNIDRKLFNSNDCFLEQVLYHEFTHLLDSLHFLEYPYKKFTNLMTSYSEFHAAKIEMMKRIKQSEDNTISLESEIIYGYGVLTIESFMEQSFRKLVNAFIKNSNTNSSELYFETNPLYYHLGRISALNEIGIRYSFPYYEIEPSFLMSCKDIHEYLLSGEIDFDIIESSYLSLERTVKECFLCNIMLTR